jgi:hypothetical protein
MFTVRIGNETTVYYYYTPFKYNIQSNLRSKRKVGVVHDCRAMVRRTINGRTDSMHIHSKSLCTLNGPLVGLNYALHKLSCRRRVKR